MVKGEEDVAIDILEHVLWSGLFNNRRSEVALRMTIIGEGLALDLIKLAAHYGSAYSIRTRSFEKIIDNSRRLAQMHQFRPEPFLIMLASLGGGGLQAQTAWMSLQLQKFIHRELRISDDSVKGLKLRYVAKSGRWMPVIKVGLSRRLGDDVDDEDDGESESAMVGESTQETPLPKVASPHLNIIYGQHMISAKAYQSALGGSARFKTERSYR